MEVFDITNPPFNEQIWPVPSDFVKSRFHCIQNNKSLNKSYQPILKAEADNSYLDLNYSGLKKKLLLIIS